MGEEAETPMLTDDLIKEGWGLVGYAGGLFFHDLETWKLYDEEAGELTRKTRRFISAIDKKALKRWEKKYGKHIPALSLAGSVAIVFGSRAFQSFQKRREAKNGKSVQEPARGPAPGSATRAPGPVASSPAGAPSPAPTAHVNSPANGSGPRAGAGPSNAGPAREVPFTKFDGASLDPQDAP